MIRNYPCATEQGVAAHIRYFDAPCPTCKAWLAKVKAGEASKPAPIKAPKPPKVQREPRKRAECGTTPGFHQHEYYKTEICQPCRDANRQAKADYRERTGSR